MAKIRFIVSCVLTVLCLMIHACNYSDGKKEESVFTQLPEIQEIKPLKPVKIKLKRSTGGNYSWDLHGDNADRIIDIDKKLRAALDQ